MRNFVACRNVVADRGRPPLGFLNELVDWGQVASPEVFARNRRNDIYASIAGELGPWQSDLHRRAAMLEVLRVLAGYESSWNWLEGRDEANDRSRTPCTEEAGIFQCSGDSMAYAPELRELVVAQAGDDSCATFQRISKERHTFAFEYCARLLRITTGHHGPIKFRHIHQWLRRDAVSEFEALLL